MTRLHRSLAMVSVLALAAGCGNKNKDNQTDNPDQAVDGESGDAAGGDGDAAGPSRARGSTATRGAGRNVAARKVTAKKPPRAAPDPDAGDEDTGPNGLLAEAFELTDPDALLPEDMTTLGEPGESFEVPNLDYDEIDASEGFPGSSGLEANYAIRFSGSLNITEEAEYELCLHSDDGSQLLLEDMLVIDNNGIHEAPVETCELLYLPPGEYMLEIDYMQGSGPLLAMHFAWSMNGGDKVIVPPEVLFKPVEVDPATGE